MVEVGGGIRTYTVGGVPVIDGYRRAETCTGGRGQVLAPWPNRLGDGAYSWEGHPYQAPLTEPEHHNAIHGLVRWASWNAAEEDEDRVRLEYRLHPQPGWAWILDLSVTYTLTDAGLEVHTVAHNLPGGGGRCPFGLGWHPYLAAFNGLVDDVELTVGAETVYQTDERGLPTGTRPVEGSDADFRTRRRIGDARLDTAYTDLARDAEGRATVEVASYSDSRQRIHLWMGPEYTHLMVYTGDTLSEVHRRRRGLAIEPMTCAPDMFRTGDGRVLLDERERFAATWGLLIRPS